RLEGDAAVGWLPRRAPPRLGAGAPDGDGRGDRYPALRVVAAPPADIASRGAAGVAWGGGRPRAWQARVMGNTLVLTVLAPDRTGLVELLAQRIAAAGGNWEESRMARLAGQFAGILLVTCDAARSDELAAAVRALDSAGLQVTARAAPGDASLGAAAGARVQLALT